MSASRAETRVIVVLCAFAALRVLVFSAAFPFFSNVDEQGHFDLVCKYARGHVPGGLEHWDADAARLIVLYDTPEYFDRPEQYPGGVYPPPHRLATPGDRAAYERQVAALVETDNHESTQPPVYYAVAGIWYRIGVALGLKGGHILYWMRFLNVPVAALVTWIAFVAARAAFPDRIFPRLGVPILVAAIPQDALYLVNNDVLLPLVGGGGFLCVWLAARGPLRSAAFHAGAGLLIAAAVLVKFSSVAFVPFAAAMVAASVLGRKDAVERKAALARGALLLAAAAVPIALWCARNVVVLGDVTGSAEKTRSLGWTLQPLRAMIGHPIFTPSGFAVFWQGTLATFWRGELVWGLDPIASKPWDVFYGVSSFVLVGAAGIAPFVWRRDRTGDERAAMWSALAVFLLSLGFLAAVSVAYDFGDCFYPSRALPFMASGRLASGALIPFAILYLSGLDALLPARLSAPIRFAVLIVPLALVTVSELLLSKPAFFSAYNGFHLG